MAEAEVIKRTGQTPITRGRLERDLLSLGVQPGMTLLVHSSLSKIGWICGGAVAVIQALQAALGPEGTLVMPAHSGDWSDPEEWSNPPVPQNWKEIIRQTMPAFDPALTPTRGMGRIAETFRSGPGVIRSSHPQTSFTAWGKYAREITEGHALDYSLGQESPLARVYDLHGWILLLGVGHESNTSLHLAEHRAEYAGKKALTQGSPLLVDGERRWISFQEWEENSEEFETIGQAYREVGGRSLTGRVGLADCQLIPQRDLVDFAGAWIENHW